MTDYKQEYLCEMKRADQLEDELAEVRRECHALRAELAALLVAREPRPALDAADEEA